MYADAWRIMRDWFYDPSRCTRVDWKLRRSDKYLPLVAHTPPTARDLDFILGELIGELNCGHTYVTDRRDCRPSIASTSACWAASSSRSATPSASPRSSRARTGPRTPAAR